MFGHASASGSGVDIEAELRRIAVAARSLQRTVGATLGSGGRDDGHDATGMIRVVVDGRGRVQEVSVDRSWRRHLDQTRLGAALMEAYGGAGAKALTRALDSYDAAAADVTAAREDEAVVDRMFAAAAAHPRRLDPEDLPEYLERQFHEIEMIQRYGDLGGPTPSADDPGETSVFGPGRFVELTVRSGQVVDARIHLSRMPPTDAGALGREALAAFRAAQAR
jgi:hypothetical protein